MATSIERLCIEAERRLPGVACSVLRVDVEGRLQWLAGPSRPDMVVDATEVAAVELGNGAMAADIDSAHGMRAFPLPEGMKSCWSIPILDTDGSMLGALALSFRELREPSAEERRIADACSRLCSIAFERDRRDEAWRHQASSDVLTGLGNRTKFDEAISRLECHRPGGWGLIAIDLDHLKYFNDTFGHRAGDCLLECVAERVVDAGAANRVFRIGGDEFIVIVEEPGYETTLADMAERIHQRVGRAAVCDGHAIVPQTTIGYALLEAGDCDGAAVRRKADLALYHAKETQRGGSVAYSPGLGLAITNRLGSLQLVEAALAEGRIDAYYQPIFLLDTREIVGLEALCRMKMPDGRVVSAGAFHEALCDASIASQVSRVMLDTVASDIRTWLDLGIPVQHVGINLASADFRGGGVARRVTEAFGRYDVPLKHVIVEVTEHVYLGRGDDAVAREIADLRRQGFLVALDDFGTGFASLTHLLTIPVDIIKLDKSFVDRMAPGEPGAAIIGGLMHIAKELSIRVVAEGVETESQAVELSSIGGRLGQGFLFSPAVDREAATRLLVQHAQRPLEAGADQVTDQALHQVL
ncbi:putative bifunctional diguanylate cyclase/phosphodiesterase [Jiella marina]|uniref:putative bifunctional diguanylate cyclase/phosphodiesterase n=1 Tax=Jiella sp. LLJ827 TaxID=2917712 RepID=UPI0021019A24|nr:EAL domain-containing protein [Jiella sp. LLJ827]MCQ0988920.1 EAL domain-containing protein [Jiella sp. LLJ827]